MVRLGKLALLVALLFSTHAWCAVPADLHFQPDKEDAQAARALDQVLTDPELTYSSKVQDQVFLLGVVDRYLDTLDPSRLVFTAEDEIKFKQDPRWVRAAMQGRALAAPLRIFEIYRQRLDAAMDAAIAQLEARPGFSANEVWEADRSTQPRPASGKDWSRLWRQSVQNDRMGLLAAGHDPAKVDGELANRYRQARTRIDGMSKDRVLDLFLDAYARSFDPHSNYFPPATATDFVVALSLQLDGIGVVFSREDTGVVVKEIVKGSPADKAGVMVGDRLLAFGPPAGPLLATDGMDLEAIVAKIRGKKGTQVALELSRKATGKVERIKIVRDTIQLEEQKAKWHMVEQPNHAKVAVVSLPLFYHDFQGRGQDGNSATHDVQVALRQARDQGAQAVVLDLTGNGGGSLAEAISLVGLFVPSSPVVQVRSPEGQVQVLESQGATPEWTGPLAVLIDGNSASASEIVAAALQDLGRAVVVGEQSYGKGTVQTLLDLDKLAPSPDMHLGQVKLTTAQFFRPSGISTQLLGVQPDILLGASEDKYGERAYGNALPAARVATALDKPRPLLSTDRIGQLQRAVDARVARSIIPRAPRYLPLAQGRRQKDEQQAMTAALKEQQALRKAWPEQAAWVVSQLVHPSGLEQAALSP